MPSSPDKPDKYDAIVIGSGPGGYPCGIRLGQAGKKVLVIEKEKPGGVCLNVGCIPSKAIIHASKTYEKAAHAEKMGISIGGVKLDVPKMIAWKDEVVGKLTTGVKGLLKAADAELMIGEASFAAPNALDVRTKDGTRRVEAGSIVIATGSRPIEIPGFAFDGKRILDSTGGLAFNQLPGRLIVIGGGYIGLELGIAWAKLGSKVAVVEATAGLLPGNDPELVDLVARKIKKLGIEVLLEAKATGWEELGGKARVKVAGKSGEQTLDADAVLVCVGRRPNSENLGLDRIGVAVERGFIKVDKKQRTNVPGVYAIGDVAGQPMLAHKATREGEVAAEVICGHKAEFDARAIPAVIFVDPEIATAGLTEAEAKAQGIAVKVGKFPFLALGRAISTNDTDGFCKIIADAHSEQVLGVGIVGPGATDLISEAALAIEMGALLRDVSLTIHPHPTLGEIMMETAHVALGEPLHIPRR